MAPPGTDSASAWAVVVVASCSRSCSKRAVAPLAASHWRPTWELVHAWSTLMASGRDATRSGAACGSNQAQMAASASVCGSNSAGVSRPVESLEARLCTVRAWIEGSVWPVSKIGGLSVQGCLRGGEGLSYQACVQVLQHVVKHSCVQLLPLSLLLLQLLLML